MKLASLSRWPLEHQRQLRYAQPAMNELDDLKSWKSIDSSPEFQLRAQALARVHGEHWAALVQMPSKKDVDAAMARIIALQGLVPAEKAWLRKPWEEAPPHEPGWGISNLVNPSVAKQVYDEYVAAGKISRPENKNFWGEIDWETMDSEGI